MAEMELNAPFMTEEGRILKPHWETDDISVAELMKLPRYRGPVYFTDCTCRAPSKARGYVQGRGLMVCSQCGSARWHTGT